MKNRGENRTKNRTENRAGDMTSRSMKRRYFLLLVLITFLGVGAAVGMSKTGRVLGASVNEEQYGVRKGFDSAQDNYVFEMAYDYLKQNAAAKGIDGISDEDLRVLGTIAAEVFKEYGLYDLENDAALREEAAKRIVERWSETCGLQQTEVVPELAVKLVEDMLEAVIHTYIPVVHGKDFAAVIEQVQEMYREQGVWKERVEEKIRKLAADIGTLHDSLNILGETKKRTESVMQENAGALSERFRELVEDSRHAQAEELRRVSEHVLTEFGQLSALIDKGDNALWTALSKAGGELERLWEETKTQKAEIEEEELARETAIKEEVFARETAIEEEALAREAAIREEELAREAAVREERLARETAIGEETLARERAVSSEAAKREKALEEERSARKNAIAKEAQLRGKAIEEEAQFRMSAIEEEARLREKAIEEEARLREKAMEEEARLREKAMEEEAQLRGSAIEEEALARERAVSRMALAGESLSERMNLLKKELNENISVVEKTVNEGISGLQEEFGRMRQEQGDSILRTRAELESALTRAKTEADAQITVLGGRVDVLYEKLGEDTALAKTEFDEKLMQLDEKMNDLRKDVNENISQVKTEIDVSTKQSLQQAKEEYADSAAKLTGKVEEIGGKIGEIDGKIEGISSGISEAFSQIDGIKTSACDIGTQLTEMENRLAANESAVAVLESNAKESGNIYELPNGMLLQWGEFTVSSVEPYPTVRQEIGLEHVFSGTEYSVVFTPYGGSGLNLSAGVISKSNSSFIADVHIESAGGGTIQYSWMAIGY